MTTTPRPNAVEAAKQGNPKAIAVLLNQALKSHGCIAQVLRNDAALRILIEGPMTPDETTIGSLVENGLRNLDLAEITPQVQVYGQQIGQPLPVWSKSFDLGGDVATANIFSFDTIAVELPQPAAPQPTPTQPAPVPPIGAAPNAKAASMRAIAPPDMPRNYLVPAIFVLLLTIFPVSVVPLIYATQVAGKYDRGDYDGAATSSRRAKLWCMINAGIAVPFYLLVGVLIIIGFSSFSGKVEQVKQEREVTDRLNMIMRAEQAYYLENSRFAPNLSDLGRLPSSQSAELKDIYTYKVTVLDGTSVQVTAIPNRRNFHSFTAGAIVIGSDVENRTTQAIVCRSEESSMMAVKMPVVQAGKLDCAPGSEPVTAGRRGREAEGEVESRPKKPPYDAMG
jgi:type II secretory pathway pseudopilin PulG